MVTPDNRPDTTTEANIYLIDRPLEEIIYPKADSDSPSIGQAKALLHIALGETVPDEIVEHVLGKAVRNREILEDSFATWNAGAENEKLSDFRRAISKYFLPGIKGLIADSFGYQFSRTSFELRSGLLTQALQNMSLEWSLKEVNKPSSLPW